LPQQNAPVPLVDLQAQFRRLRDRIETGVLDALAAGRHVLGPQVGEFEEAVAHFTHSRHAVSVANGTDALQIALMAEDIGPGDAVFVPAFTFVASAEVIASVGATPVFVDIQEPTFTMDPLHLAHCTEEITRQGRLRARAVMPVDLFGLPASYPEIGAVARRHNLFVIADAAQSIGGELDGRRVGSLADATATSFYPSKPLGCYGDGGCIFVDDDDRAQKMRLIRGHGLEPGTGNALRVAMNSRLDTLQAAILLVKLEAFAAELEARANIARWYADRLSGVAVTPREPDGYRSAWAVYSILLDGRDRVRQALQENGISTAVYYARALHLQPAYEQYGEGAGSLPVTEGFSGRILSLPMSPYLTEETVDRVCRIIVDHC